MCIVPTYGLYESFVYTQLVIYSIGTRYCLFVTLPGASFAAIVAGESRFGVDAGCLPLVGIGVDAGCRPATLFPSKSASGVLVSLLPQGESIVGTVIASPQSLSSVLTILCLCAAGEKWPFPPLFLLSDWFSGECCCWGRVLKADLLDFLCTDATQLVLLLPLLPLGGGGGNGSLLAISSTMSGRGGGGGDGV